jgi:hypothetical protein
VSPRSCALPGPVDVSSGRPRAQDTSTELESSSDGRAGDRCPLRAP